VITRVTGETGYVFSNLSSLQSHMVSLFSSAVLKMKQARISAQGVAWIVDLRAIFAAHMSQWETIRPWCIYRTSSFRSRQSTNSASNWYTTRVSVAETNQYQLPTSASARSPMKSVQSHNHKTDPFISSSSPPEATNTSAKSTKNT
jgi:hypothetical protein